MTISYYELIKQLVGAFSYGLLDVIKDEIYLLSWWNLYGIFQLITHSKIIPTDLDFSLVNR